MYFIFQLCGCFVSYVVCGVCACHSPLIYDYNNLFKTNEKPQGKIIRPIEKRRKDRRFFAMEEYTFVNVIII